MEICVCVIFASRINGGCGGAVLHRKEICEEGGPELQSGQIGSTQGFPKGGS